MSLGAASLIAPQRFSYAVSSIAHFHHRQCAPVALRRISPASSLQCTIYLSRRHTSSKSPKRTIPTPKPSKPSKAAAAKPPPAKSQSQAQKQTSKPQPAKLNTARPLPQNTKPHPPSTAFPEPPSERLNLPPTSYPPPLEIPPRNPGQSWFSYLWTQGKAYVQFYKTGTQNVRATAREAKRLRKIQKEASSKAKSAEHEAGASGANGTEGIVLSRAEWQLVRRSRADLIRLPFFGIFLIAFGEWTPLLIMFLTPIVPQPCRIPAQVRKELQRLESRRRERLQTLALKAPALIHADRRPGTAQIKASPLSLELSAATVAKKVQEVKDMSSWELLNVGARLDAYSGVWEYFMTPPLPWLRFAVRRKLEYLVKDDALIGRDGGYKGLGPQELRKACVERGIFVQDKNDSALRKELAHWFQKSPTRGPAAPSPREKSVLV